MDEISNNIIKEIEEKNYSWEKEGKNIINPSKRYLTNDEKIILQYCFKSAPLPDELREEYWILITGAKKLKLENPEYYKTLLNNYPVNPLSDKSETQISLDIYRTFPEDENFRKEKIDSLKNILIAYSRRNCSLGYCQGFNYIVGKLLKVVKDEENAFWIFTQIIENILPINYYYDSVGIIIDNNILFEKLERTNRSLMVHFKNNKFELMIKNILYKWLICLFSQNIKDELLFLIWDIFFIEGTSTLFKTIIIIFEKNKDELMQITSLDKLIDLFDSVHSLSLLNQHKEELLKDLMKCDKQINSASIKEGRRKKYRKIKESMKKFDKKKHDNFGKINCDENWDNCLNIKSRNDGDDFVVFQKNERIEIIENYFIKKYKRNNSVKIKKNRKNIDKLINEYYDYDKLIVQRRKHLCNQAKRKRIKSCININNNNSKNKSENKNVNKEKEKNEIIKNNKVKNSEEVINKENQDEDNYDILTNTIYYDL